MVNHNKYLTGANDGVNARCVSDGNGSVMIVAPSSQLRSVGAEKALTATQTFPRFKSKDGDAFKECSSTDIALDPVKPSAIPDAFKNRLIRIKRNNDGRYLTLEDNDGQKTVTLKAPFTGESQIWKVKQLDASGNIFGIVSHADENCILRMNDSTNGCFISSNTGSDFAGTGVSITHDQEIGGYTIMLSTNHRYLDIFTDVDGAVVNSDLMWTKMDSVGWGIEIMPQLGETVMVTGMPHITNYPYPNGVETFHPESGMRSGTWEENNGAFIESAIKKFYTAVYKSEPAHINDYMYSLYAAKHTPGKYVGQYHPGVDISKQHGAAIYAARDGKVVAIDTYFITVESSDKYLIYTHLRPSVNLDDLIVAGETLLGYQSNLGLGLSESDLASGKDSHLHIEVHNNHNSDKRPQNPTATANDQIVQPIPPYSFLT